MADMYSQFSPRIQVLLYKTIDRTSLNGSVPVSARYEGKDTVIDLSDFLGDGSSVRTSKSVKEPAGGFAITMTDQPHLQWGEDALESIYGLIEPMDFIEIRMAHDAMLGAAIPIVMRGFVSDISRSQTMDASGRPMRVVTITGQDYGKLWQMMQILFFPGNATGQELLTNFKLTEKFGIGLENSLSGGDFVKQVFEKIINPYLAGIMPENSPNPKTITVDEAQIAQHGTVFTPGVQMGEGTISDLLRRFTDVGTFNELFTEDREDGVYCVYRAIPVLDIEGKPIQDDAPAPEYVTVRDSDIISINVSRSDANVANFYWVRSPHYEMVSDIQSQLYALKGDTETIDLREYPNSAQKFYADRVMYGQTEMGGDDVKVQSSGQDAEGQGKRDTSMMGWINDRRKIMVNMNKDNVILERGSMRVRGSAELKAGYFVELVMGRMISNYYILQVDHEYIPYQGFFSTLTVERGTGFVERSKLEGGRQSPYLRELMRR